MKILVCVFALVVMVMSCCGTQTQYNGNDTETQNVNYIHIHHNSKIVLLGDSITAQLWENKLLDSHFINRGVGGDTTKQMYDRLPKIINSQPEVCFIMAGVNDLFQAVPMASTLTNMEKIVTDLQKEGIRPVIQSVLYVVDSNWAKSHNKTTEKLNDEYKRICEENGIDFIDVNSVLSEAGSLRKEFSSDGIHLNAKGNEVWIKFLLSLIVYD